MGNWHISIQGTGIHHNENNPNDADKLAKEFVKRLKSAGQVVTIATITYGGSESIDE